MFKHTEVSDVHEQWQIRKVTDLFVVETGTTPSTKKREYWEFGSVNWVTPTDLSKSEGKIKIGKSERKVTETALKETTLTLLPKNSIIISTRAPVGYVAMVEQVSTFNQGCKGLIPIHENKISSEFYCYYFLYKKQSLQNLSSGSTFKELSKERLGKFSLPLPPLSEQKKIAKILTEVDQAIEKINEAIQKTQRLKKGLMQELLTKGIGHKEFKKAEIGRMPKEWEITKIEDISLDFIGGGTPLTSNPNYWNGDIAWMTSAHISEREVKTGQRYITKEGLKNSAAQIVPKDSLIVATRVGIGKVAINKIDIAISQDLTGIVIDKNKTTPDFLYWVLINIYKKLKALAQGSTIKGILRNELGKIKFYCPPILEQDKIAEILISVDNRISSLRNKREKLQIIKKGLMEDLLTGKKRVKLEA